MKSELHVRTMYSHPATCGALSGPTKQNYFPLDSTMWGVTPSIAALSESTSTPVQWFSIPPLPLSWHSIVPSNGTGTGRSTSLFSQSLAF